MKEFWEMGLNGFSAELHDCWPDPRHPRVGSGRVRKFTSVAGSGRVHMAQMVKY